MKKRNSIIRKRILGIYLLTKALLPLILVFLFLLLSYQTVSPNSNRDLINEYYYQQKVLILHYEDLSKEIEILQVNASNKISELESIINQLQSYKTQIQEGSLEVFKKAVQDFKENLDRVNQIKALMIDVIEEYIKLVKEKILEVKQFVSDCVSFKDDIVEFLSDLSAQLEPLNDLIDFVSTLDVLGIFDTFTIQFPELPSIPSFPTFNLEDFQPDLSEIINAAKNLKSGLVDDVQELKNEILTVLNPGDLVNAVKSFTNKDSLYNQAILPIIEVGKTLEAYWVKLKEAKTEINYDLIDKNNHLKPYIRLFSTVLLFWLFILFIDYLRNLKSKIEYSLELIFYTENHHTA